jgi:hypothetical protein
MSPRTCLSCRRLNPSLAAYCWFDGTALVRGTQAHPAVGTQAFPTPFVFPSGRSCRSFEELARTCRQNWAEARGLLQNGAFRLLLVVLGRPDLVQEAERAAAHPDVDLGLDDFLARLPGCQPAPPGLEVTRAEIDLGTVAVGQDRIGSLTIVNTGERLLIGFVRSENCLWLGVSAPQLNEKRFKAPAGQQLEVPLHVRGQFLQSGPQPQVGVVAIESNGGVRQVQVRITVPVTPSPGGVLTGTHTPQQTVEHLKIPTQQLPPVPAPLPPLPDQAWQAPGQQAIPLAEARVDSAAARSRRRRALVCLVLSFLLLLSSAALAAWKILIRDRESPSPASDNPRAAGVAPPERGRVRGRAQGESTSCRIRKEEGPCPGSSGATDASKAT